MSPEKQNELVTLAEALMLAQVNDKKANGEVYRAESHKRDTAEALRQAEWAMTSFYAENRP